jgi:uncharacterized protein YycO
MEKLTIVFAKGRHPISYLIRLVTWSRWSHIAVVFGDEVLESVGGIGVVKTPLPEFIARYSDVAFAEIPCDSKDVAYQRLTEQCGKPYDFWALLGIVFRLGSWADDNKWFCSELVAYATGLWRQERNKRVTPENIWRASM